MESIKSEKFQQLDKNEMKNIKGAWGWEDTGLNEYIDYKGEGAGGIKTAQRDIYVKKYFGIVWKTGFANLTYD